MKGGFLAAFFDLCDQLKNWPNLRHWLDSVTPYGYKGGTYDIRRLAGGF